ncbi:MAG: ATP-binding protein [Gemmatimonadota bacterium]|jgi:signal transduction histidine kinase|nr:HAMP domain-containing histidine kinase [Gemmatimonadota bacterium]
MTRTLIRRRVAAWFGLSVFVVLVAAAVVLRQLFADALDREFGASQEGIGALVHSFFLAEVPEYKTVENTLAHIAAEHDFAQSRVHFVRPDGTTFEPLPGAGTAHPTLAPPVRAATFPLERDLAPGWTVRVETSAATLVASRRRLDWWLAATVGGAVLAALLAGWLLTGRALAPVRAMTDAAAAMGPQAPGRRLPVADARDELGLLAERFNALLDRLDDAMVQQKRFLAVAAHELRTPIARLRSEAEVARLAGADAGEALGRIERDLQGLAAMVDQLLQLARADALPEGVTPVAASLDDVVAEAVERWRAPATARGLSLAVRALDEAPARLDVPYAARLVDVLLDNAVRYTPRGGTVTVAAGLEDGRATVTIDDTGPGVPAADRPHVFDRFWRGGSARQAVPEGSGLGLALAKWIAEAHGATIAVGEAPGGGARFQVVFPVA